MAFIAGPYTWTFDTSPLGVVEDAPRLTARFGSIVVTGDNLGDTIQTVLNRGGNLYLDMVLQEYNQAGAIKAFWPNKTGSQSVEANIGTIPAANLGCERSSGELKGTKVTGSCASPDIWTASKAMLAPDYDISFLLGSRLRNVPISLLLLPDASGNYIVGSAAP